VFEGPAVNARPIVRDRALRMFDGVSVAAPEPASFGRRGMPERSERVK